MKARTSGLRSSRTPPRKTKSESPLFSGRDEVAEEELTVLKDTREIRPSVRSWSKIVYQPLNLHITTSRIFASVRDESSERDRSWIKRLSISYVDVRRIVLSDKNSQFMLYLNRYSGAHHFWSISVPVFLLTRQQFDELRVLLPTISALKDKVELPA